MFNKPTFGSNTSGFGSFNTSATTASPFGGFKPAGTGTAFGAPPAFGATPAQPNTGGLFGASNTSTGLFGGTTSTAAPAFGTTTSGFGFGASTSSGLFGSNTTSTGLFGNAQNTSAFGAKPAGFGFGGTSTTGATGGSLFGSTPTAGTGLFGQQTNTMGGSLFSNNSTMSGGTFGQAGATAGAAGAGTAHAKYSPVLGTDVVVKAGASQTVNIKHHCITCMKEYENKSLEELRLEDYTAGRKGSTSGVFGFQQQEAKPLFGGSTAFGQPATTTASSVFGGGGLGTGGGFGQTNTFSFGSNAQNTTNTTGSLFGAAKPAFGASSTTGTGLFGATTTQASTFGTTTPSFGFGSNTQNQQQTVGLFGAKPATTGFGAAPASSGFGPFGSSSLFGQAKPLQTTAPAFGNTAAPFGQTTGAFGTTTGGNLFSGGGFAKPAQQQTGFGFNAPSTGLGTGLGTGLNTSFQAKPAGQQGFGLGGGTLFTGQTNNTFNTGFPSSLDSGLGGGGLFSNTSSLGGSALGLGLGANTAQQQNNLSGSSAAGNVHEQILTLVARPYGDSPLFKDLPPDNTQSADVLKPTNPAAVKAAMEHAPHYRVAQQGSRLRVIHAPASDKKCLFDGLEESDASLEDKLSLKPSRKRLVLRPQVNTEDSADETRNRSLEEKPQYVSGKSPKETEDVNHKNNEEDRYRKDASYGENNNLETSSDRHGSWLNASKHQWSAEKEKSKDGDTSSSLYPNLDKEIFTTLERRASWLTTKPLRKPLSNNPDAAENSVRELGVRADRSQDKENVDTLSDTTGMLSFLPCCPRPGRPSCIDCEMAARQLSVISVSEEEHVAPRDMPPHPTGVKLTRPGYYTIPSLDEMIKYMRSDGSCVVPHLTIGRKNYGNVYYDSEVDVAGLDLDSLVFFLNKEVTVYPDDSAKPPVGEGLNRRAIVTLDRIWPRDKTEKKPITDPERLQAMDYEGKLRRVCDKHDTKFIEYRPQTGSWVFRVEHFSKYSLTDSDEEDDPTPEVMKRQLINQQLQKAAPLAQPKPPIQAPGLGGLGGPVYPQLSSLPGLNSPGLSGLAPGMSPGLVPMSAGGLGLAGPPLVGHDDLYAMQQTSLNLLNGAGKAFDMDTTEENTESQSMYQDSHKAFGVKSPTSELARLEHRQSHNVQLMKASLYADSEMEDDVSVSTGDQQVPRAAPPPAPRAPSLASDTMLGEEQLAHVVNTEELPMRPLIVRPHTIVLKYHRKVPPFSQTIAGRLSAACLADVSVSRARHARAGFGPRAALVYTTAYDCVAHLPHSADLSELGKYVAGRAADDWSESCVVRLALGEQNNKTFLEIFTRHLDTLLEYSSFSETKEESCPRLTVLPSPQERRAALQRLAQNYHDVPKRHAQFGVSSSYCYEVFRLCEALWGADLENDGIAGMDEASIVNRHKMFLEWLKEAVSDITDEELKQPRLPDPNDESDAHSEQVWTLLLGGRVTEACKVAAEHGDYNMAAILAQSAGEASFRSLLSRQVSLWRECGADTRLAARRLAALRLVAGLRAPRTDLLAADWLRALHATARYLCPQVPSLEQVVRTYESFFVPEDTEEVDLSTVPADELGMKLPLPPHGTDYMLSIVQNGRERRVLDLRYELIRARAMNTRPKLQPASYTPDPMDYSLCFVVGAWFGVVTADIVCGAAWQLEAAGAWHRAIQALLYHPDDVARNHLIREMLSRHAPARADTPELQARLQLLRRLRLPPVWLRLAQAHRAKYERLPAVEVEHLVEAKQWNAAHKVLLDELLPDAVLADDLQSIAPLIEKLNEAAQNDGVSGWDSGGQALHHYIHVCDEIRGLVSLAGAAGAAGAAGGVCRRLEALRPRVAAACRALGRLAAPRPRHAAARAEMGARLVQLALAAGEPPHHLAALLKALRLPPDCTAHAQQKITTELAERASDMCIESTNSSPISSHHRTMVQS